MNKNSLKVLLLASLLSLCACGETATSPSVEPSSSATPSETPSETATPSIEESSTVEESSTPTESSVESTSEEPSIPQTLIELNKYIYVVGDTFDKDNVVSFQKYNAALEGYGTLSNFTVSSLPETCPNGPVEITLSAGKTKGTVTIYYYDDIETAAKNTTIELGEDVPMCLDLSTKRPDDITGGFYIRDYLKKSGEINDTKLSILVKGENYYSKVGAQPIYLVNEKSKEPTWTSHYLELWTDGVTATLDPSKTTVPHLEYGGTEYTATNYEPVHNGDQSLTDMTTLYSYDIIIDAEGHIAYFGRAKYSNGAPSADTLIDIASGVGYWSYYKNYQENPCFVFADTYDPNSDDHKFDYEKIIPEGGCWIVGQNNKATALDGEIDGLYRNITGKEGYIYNEISPDNLFNINYDDATVEANLMSALIFADSVNRQAAVYKAADNNQIFAYYYSKAYLANNTELLAEAEDVLKALIYQNLPQVAQEENLAAYYESTTTQTLMNWVAKFDK